MIERAKYTQRLDAAGDFQADLPLSDPQTAALQAGRIYRHYQEGRGFCFAGSIETNNKVPPERLAIAGDSLLVELLHANTLIGRAYSSVSVDSIIDDLLTGTGWTRLGSIPTQITVRFDGESILRAVLAVVALVGQHVRERITESGGSLIKQLEIGAFGASPDVVVSSGVAGPLALDDPGLAAIPDGEFAIEQAATEVWNWLLPLGSGEGASQLTLVQQTRLPSLITTNPSFENALTDWTLTGTPTQDTTRAVHGGACVKMVSAGSDLDVRQTFSAAAGAIYRAEAWTWKDTSGGDDRLIVEFLDGGEAVLATHEVINAVLAQWVRLDTGEMIAPASTLSVRIRLQNNTPGDHTSYFDLPRLWRVASDVGQPYDILTTLTKATDLFPQLNWYISDPASIAAHGQRQRPFVAKDIVPLAFTKTAYQVAANSLYDLAAAQLDRWKFQQNAYRLGVLGLRPDVYPGDTIRLRYRGMARRAAGDADDERYLYVDVDEDVYVLERTTEWADYRRDTLLVSDLDRQLQNDDEVVIGKLEDTIRAFNTHVQTGIAVWAEQLGPEEVDATHQFVFNARIPDNIVQLLRLLITITPRAIRSPVDVAAGGGAAAPTTSSGGGATPTSSSGGGQTPTSAVAAAHVHKMFLLLGAGGTWTDPPNIFTLRSRKSDGISGQDIFVGYDPASVPPTEDLWTYDANGSHSHTVTIAAHDHTVTIAGHTHTVDIPSHAHALTFGIFEGTGAAGIGIEIDGASRTTLLGGPWSAPATIDITRFFLDDDSVVVQGDHTIKLSSVQLGRIEVRLEWAVTAAALKV